MATLTVSNSVVLLSVLGLFPTPVPISGYSVDDAFASEEVENGETLMGVDNKLSAGYVPYVVPLDIHLQADSLSNAFFDTWIGAELRSRDKYVANGSVLIQGTGELFTFKRGFLRRFTPMPEGKKILQPRRFRLEFEEMTKGPI